MTGDEELLQLEVMQPRVFSKKHTGCIDEPFACKHVVLSLLLDAQIRFTFVSSIATKQKLVTEHNAHLLNRAQLRN